MDTKFDEFYKRYVTDAKDYFQMEKEFNELLTSCFEAFPSLKLIVFKGETPSFNDGDVCLHEESIAIVCEDGIYDETHGYDGGWMDSNKKSCSSMVYDGAYETVTIDIPVSFSKRNPPHPKKVSKLKQLLKQQTLTYSLWETNYIIEYRMENEKLSMKKHEYWPVY